MDNENFKQQFTQNVRSASAQPAVAVEAPSRLPLFLSMALAAIVLVESIALVITLTNYFSLANPTDVEEQIDEETYVDNVYFYDEQENLSAFNLICTLEDGAKYTFDQDNKYVQYDSASTQVETGTYSIFNSSVLTLGEGDNSRTVYFDGFSIADGTTLYGCEGVANDEATTE